ncbi:MAG: methyltransferase domain-containing protein [Hyphomicrobium sp.]|nr:methyltransferase domain-containing protein [Hyphomicrobium sp.]
MSGAPSIFDRALLRDRRNRRAGEATRHDFLLERVADDFAERLSIVRRTFPMAANIGAYHGVVSRRLRQNASVGSMIDVEVSPALLAQCDGPSVLADSEVLPFAPESLDLIVSGLAWQLINDIPGVLAQARRALKPDGLLLAAFLGGDTLKELRQAWLAAEAEILGGASPRVAPFADVRDLGGLLQRAGFALPVADSDVFHVTYADPLAMMREVQGMAASNMLVERRRVPVTRGLLMRACEIYAERFALADGRIPATFEIITLTAWVPHESQQKPLKPGSATMRLAEALGVEEHGTGDVVPVTPKDREAKE